MSFGIGDPDIPGENSQILTQGCFQNTHCNSIEINSQNLESLQNRFQFHHCASVLYMS